MENVKALLSTSVADAKSSLECLLMSNPQQALEEAQLAVDFINRYGHAANQKSRMAMLTIIVNKARKHLAS